ncbi:ribonuclease T2 family protein [Arenibaculum pallidiluteum]|uniref:ribonuclease T2 family protein n=1 Tax=Arenibaculum pallidiluteum TaxID=2812559 RepID=UPI001A95D346|nr:ribonuclease T2 [Arenibaculum pallidiluteum]
MPALRLLRVLAALTALAASSDALAQESGRERRGEPGRFDYWVLSLSWSPAHCAEEPDADPRQCGPGRRFAFVLHGLWPQWERGSWPQYCAVEQDVPREVPRDVEDAMLPVMPSRGLVRHQWNRHGTCSGLSAAEYFRLAREAFGRIRIPEALISARQPVTLEVDAVERLFAEVNPGFSEENGAVVCRKGLLAEIRICLDRKLGFRNCGRGVQDRCPLGEATIPPLP